MEIEMRLKNVDAVRSKRFHCKFARGTAHRSRMQCVNEQLETDGSVVFLARIGGPDVLPSAASPPPPQLLESLKQTKVVVTTRTATSGLTQGTSPVLRLVLSYNAEIHIDDIFLDYRPKLETLSQGTDGIHLRVQNNTANLAIRDMIQWLDSRDPSQHPLANTIKVQIRWRMNDFQAKEDPITPAGLFILKRNFRRLASIAVELQLKTGFQEFLLNQIQHLGNFKNAAIKTVSVTAFCSPDALVEWGRSTAGREDMENARMHLGQKLLLAKTSHELPAMSIFLQGGKLTIELEGMIKHIDGRETVVVMIWAHYGTCGMTQVGQALHRVRLG